MSDGTVSIAKARVIVLTAPNARAYRPARHRLRRVGRAKGFELARVRRLLSQTGQTQAPAPPTSDCEVPRTAHSAWWFGPNFSRFARACEVGEIHAGHRRRPAGRHDAGRQSLQ
jgi:hypothetical protein